MSFKISINKNYSKYALAQASFAFYKKLVRKKTQIFLRKEKMQINVVRFLGIKKIFCIKNRYF